MFPHSFFNYFDRVTKGVHKIEYPSIEKNLIDANVAFNSHYNLGILDRPELYDSYAEMLQNAMRADGAPSGLVDEVGKRLREFFRVEFNVF